MNRMQDTLLTKKVFEKECYPAFEKLLISNDKLLSLAELEIYSDRRKVCREDYDELLAMTDDELYWMFYPDKNEKYTVYPSLAEHYQLVIMPAAVRKPKQKPSVEGSVGK